VALSGEQILTAVAYEFKKRVVRLGNAVKLSGNDAGNGRLARHPAHASPASPQLLITLAAVAKIAHHARNRAVRWHLENRVLVYQTKRPCSLRPY
jgi:hypothetical protein